MTAAGPGGCPPAFDPGWYAKRNTVERCFSKLKQFRAVATRYDKRERIYQGTIDVASISIWLRDPVQRLWQSPRSVGAAGTTVARSCSSASPSPRCPPARPRASASRKGGLDLLLRRASDQRPPPARAETQQQQRGPGIGRRRDTSSLGETLSGVQTLEGADVEEEVEHP